MDHFNIHYFYKTINDITGEYYGGIHSTNRINDGYKGSGKLLLEAMKKYGRENFTLFIVKFFDTRKEALEYEAVIVDEDWVRSDCNYNVRVGGAGSSVRTSSKEVVFRGVTYPSNSAAARATGHCRKTIVKYCGDPNMTDCYCVDDEQKELAYQLYLNSMANPEFRKRNIEKRSESLRKTYENGFTDKHRKNMSISRMKIKNLNAHNKDPEKIRKTAETHRGMIRGEQARENMRNGMRNSEKNKERGRKRSRMKAYHNPDNQDGGHKWFVPGEQPDGWVPGLIQKNRVFGKKMYHNPETGKTGKFLPDQQPQGWIPGMAYKREGRKHYHNPETGESRFFLPDQQPEGWKLGRK